MKRIFRPRYTWFDLCEVSLATTMIVRGEWAGALAVMVVGGAIGVAGEIWAGER